MVIVWRFAGEAVGVQRAGLGNHVGACRKEVRKIARARCVPCHESGKQPNAVSGQEGVFLIWECLLIVNLSKRSKIFDKYERHPDLRYREKLAGLQGQ